MEADWKRECEWNADRIRRMTLEMVRRANSGHIGGSFSIAEILAVLYWRTMNVDPALPRKAERDRLVLSKGHCAPALYAALALRGFFPEEKLKGFRAIDGELSGHAEMNHVPGVDMSTGSLGQGISVGVGMALCARSYGEGFRVHVILGDGELEEGQVWEAVMAANKYALDNLVAIVDRNRLQLDGPTAVIMDMGDLPAKFASFGWYAEEVDGHDVEQLDDALEQAKRRKGRPTVIIADTVKGKGVSLFENEVRFHGGRPTAAEYETAFAELDARIRERGLAHV